MGCTVSVRTVDDRPRLLRITTELDERDSVRLTVMDFGIGFDIQDSEILFKPLYTTNSTGMGIGLYICRSIIERFRGRVCAMRNDGPGASVSFSIPCFSSEIAKA